MEGWMGRPDIKPVITGIYDPVGKRTDGKVTSQAPLVITGRHFDRFDLKNVRLCLIPATDYEQAIEVAHVYRIVHDRVIVSLPELKPGEYFLAVKMFRKGKEEAVFVFPFSCVVLP